MKQTPINYEATSKITCMVCIIGAGSAGMGAAYALKHLGQNLVLVEGYEDLGGTAVNAWVETWIAGINPPYLLEILEDDAIKKNISEGEIDKSWLPRKFSKHNDKKIDDGMFIDRDALAKKYFKDMNEANIQIFNNHTFQSATVEGSESKRVKSIKINDKEGRTTEISAYFFIDSTGNGDLCRFVNPEMTQKKGEPGYYYGEDNKSRFEESLAPAEGGTSNMNEPSLFYKVNKEGAEHNKVINAKPSEQITESGYVNDFLPNGKDAPYWVNPMTGFGLNGIDVISEIEREGTGEETVYNKASKKLQYEHWKKVKDALEANKDKADYKGYHPKRQIGNVHSGKCAPMLGVRETYRINCEKMLTEQDIAIKIDSKNLHDFIACGSHPIDMHIPGKININAIKAFNEKKLMPSGTNYGCIIPIKISNVLIACRAYGASHIALSARRTNKDMAQLGWAAGNAIDICLKEKFNDVRDVHSQIANLQNKIGLKESIVKIESLYKESSTPFTK